MNYQEYGEQDATGLSKLIKKKEVGVDEVIRCAQQAIAQINPKLNCVVGVVEACLPEDESAPFYGVPTLLKDFPLVKGVPAERGSLLAKGFVASLDSNVWQRLRKAGFVNLGRSTSSEYGINAVTETRVAGITRNPWNPSRSVAGSSGGSAAAVASAIVPVAHASDGGGSIRTPAAFCGLVGLKPSRGRVSGFPGLVSGVGGLSVNFMLTRSVRDCAGLLDVLSAPCVGNYIDLPSPALPYSDMISCALRAGLKVGFSSQSWSETPVDDKVALALQNVVATLVEMGHHVDEVKAPFNYAEFMSVQKTIWAVNIRSEVNNMARLLGRTPSLENLQSTTWALYLAGADIDGESYASALHQLENISRQISEFLTTYDLLLTPTAMIVPEPVGTVDIDLPMATIEDVYHQLEPKETFTAPFNVSGHPAISLPVALSEGLPIGAQFVAGFGKEDMLLQVAKVFEQSRSWIRETPAIHVSSLVSKEMETV